MQGENAGRGEKIRSGATLKRQHPFYDSAAWRTLRRQIVTRDGHRCTVCGVALGKGQHRVDHIVPMKEAPHLALVPSNLRTLCATCDNNHRGFRRGTTDNFRWGYAEDGMPRDPQHIWNVKNA